MPSKESLELVNTIWYGESCELKAIESLAQELDKRGVPRPPPDGPRLRVGFDLGGTVSKYPDTFRRLIESLMSAGNVAIHYVSDSPLEYIEDQLIRNDMPYEKARVHSADYAAHGELSKKVICEHHGIHILIDDFPGYVAEGKFVRLLVMPNPHLPYYADEWTTDGSECGFGRNPQKVVARSLGNPVPERDFYSFATSDGVLYGLDAEKIKLLKGIFPGLALAVHLEKARLWAEQNRRPSKMIWPFVIRWLSREYQRMRQV